MEPSSPIASATYTSPGDVASPFHATLDTIIRENRGLLLEQLDYTTFELLANELLGVQRIFTVAAGRSGLVLRMAAMRLMHLGLSVHVVGETTTPAIRAGDLLLAMSGSGTTPSVVRTAQDARRVGARVAAVTIAAGSPLSEAANLVVIIPAATKHNLSGTSSTQYGGTLFEQSSFLAFDALFQLLRERSGQAAEELWSRHANLE